MGVQIQYSWWRGLHGRHADFWQVTGDGLDFALETLGLADPVLRARLMGLYRTFKCFPEVPEVLLQLKQQGYITAILSNGSPDMLRDAVAGSNLAGLLDHVLSVEEVGVFKPHPKVYQLTVDRLGIPASEIAFQSSNAWDAHAASAFGMRVVWCNRYGQRRERLPGHPDYEVTTLAELPALLTKAYLVSNLIQWRSYRPEWRMEHTRLRPENSGSHESPSTHLIKGSAGTIMTPSSRQRCSSSMEFMRDKHGLAARLWPHRQSWNDSHGLSNDEPPGISPRFRRAVALAS